jgi:hypothetical protein
LPAQNLKDEGLAPWILKQKPKISRVAKPIGKLQADSIVFGVDSNDPSDGVPQFHAGSPLGKWRNAFGWLARLRVVPTAPQLIKIQPAPFLDQPRNSDGEFADEQATSLDRHDRSVLGVFDVTVRWLMVVVKDSNNDPEEYRNDRHRQTSECRPCITDGQPGHH